jgi:hypothetical protein
LVRQIESLRVGAPGATALPAPLPPPLAAAAPLLATRRRVKRAAAILASLRTRDFLVGRLAKRPLSMRPAELAVGLALKELRYGHCFDRFAPEACKDPKWFLRSPPSEQRGFGYLARQYKQPAGGISLVPAGACAAVGGPLSSARRVGASVAAFQR